MKNHYIDSQRGPLHGGDFSEVKRLQTQRKVRDCANSAGDDSDGVAIAIQSERLVGSDPNLTTHHTK